MAGAQEGGLWPGGWAKDWGLCPWDCAHWLGPMPRRLCPLAGPWSMLASIPHTLSLPGRLIELVELGQPSGDGIRYPARGPSSAQGCLKEGVRHQQDWH